MIRSRNPLKSGQCFNFLFGDPLERRLTRVAIPLNRVSVSILEKSKKKAQLDAKLSQSP